MLWKKETKAPDASYVNIFTVDPIQSGWEKLHVTRQAEVKYFPLKKNDDISQTKRYEGNKHFVKRKWSAAIEKYNESLCYAAEGSTTASFAYANRAHCFMKLTFYKEALKDIELAKEKGYPMNLMPKLNQREADCLRGIEDGPRTHKCVAELRFDPDENFPCMANVLKVQRAANSDYQIIAKKDIAVGQNLIVEDSIKFLERNFGSRCINCFKFYVNLVPCQKCCVAMFCSTECQKSSSHVYECGMKLSNDNHFNAELMQIVRSIFKVMELFSNADETMTFVEETLALDELPTSLLDARSKYKAMLKQRIGRKFLDIVNLGTHCFPVYKELLKIPVVNETFNTEKHRRFLMHLIGHHTQVYHHNLFAVNSAFDGELYSCFGLMSRYFNHSCYPHTFSIINEVANIEVVAVRPIKKGEEVTTLWFPFLLNLERNQRQSKLWEYRQIRCKCLRCQGVFATGRQRKPIAAALKRFNSLPEEVMMKDSAERIAKLLQNYGHLNWCDEIEDALSMYFMVLSAHQILD